MKGGRRNFVKRTRISLDRNIAQIFNTRNLDVEAKRTLEKEE
jgi:hypothetical protein